jgi:hypothetical protein
MFRGWEIVRFSIAEAAVGASNHADIFQPWVGVPGLAFSARDASLTAITNSGGEAMAAKQYDEISDILSVKPASAGYWLTLSRMRLIAGQSSSKVLEALSLSELTGANEGDVLSWRGIFGLSLWDGAPPEVRRRTITDLAAALPQITVRQQSVARAILLEKADNVRQEIRAQLLAEGASADRLPGIGL